VIFPTASNGIKPGGENGEADGWVGIGYTSKSIVKLVGRQWRRVVLDAASKNFTDADGSKVFAKYTVTEFKPPELNGAFEFTGGTGKYQGITGNGTFHYVRVSDKAAWDELVGEYKIPTAVAGTASKN
jgi:hypothetical protein